MPDDVQPVIPEDAVEEAVRALYEAENPAITISGTGAQLYNARRPNRPEGRAIRIILTAAYPVLRSVIEAVLREQVAREIEAEQSSNEFRNVVLRRAAGIARGVGAETRKDQP